MSNTNSSKKETMKVKEITLKSSWKSTREAKFGFSNQLFLFAFITIICLLIGYLVPFTLVLSFPFLIVPSYFACTSLNAIKDLPNGKGVGFFHMFKAYFSQFFFGGYRLLVGFLKALLTYFVSTIVIITIYDLTIFADNAEYKALVDQLKNQDTMSALNSDLVDFFKNNGQISKYMLLATAIALVLGAIVYIDHIAKHSVKMRRNLFTKRLFPIRQFNFVEKRVRRDYLGEFVKTYFRTCWFIQLLIILAAGGGIVFSFFFLKEFDSMQAVVICLFLMFLVTLPFVNYISVVQDLIYCKYAQIYEDTFAKLTLEFLTKYKDKIGLAEEDAKKIEELLKNGTIEGEGVTEENHENNDEK